MKRVSKRNVYDSDPSDTREGLRGIATNAKICVELLKTKYLRPAIRESRVGDSFAFRKNDLLLISKRNMDRYQYECMHMRTGRIGMCARDVVGGRLPKVSQCVEITNRKTSLRGCGCAFGVFGEWHAVKLSVARNVFAKFELSWSRGRWIMTTGSREVIGPQEALGVITSKLLSTKIHDVRDVENVLKRHNESYWPRYPNIESTTIRIFSRVVRLRNKVRKLSEQIARILRRVKDTTDGESLISISKFDSELDLSNDEMGTEMERAAMTMFFTQLSLKATRDVDVSLWTDLNSAFEFEILHDCEVATCSSSDMDWKGHYERASVSCHDGIHRAVCVADGKEFVVPERLFRKVDYIAVSQDTEKMDRIVNGQFRDILRVADNEPLRSNLIRIARRITATFERDRAVSFVLDGVDTLMRDLSDTVTLSQRRLAKVHGVVAKFVRRYSSLLTTRRKYLKPVKTYDWTQSTVSRTLRRAMIVTTSKIGDVGIMIPIKTAVEVALSHDSSLVKLLEDFYGTNPTKVMYVEMYDGAKLTTSTARHSLGFTQFAVRFLGIRSLSRSRRNTLTYHIYIGNDYLADIAQHRGDTNMERSFMLKWPGGDHETLFVPATTVGDGAALSSRTGSAKSNSKVCGRWDSTQQRGFRQAVNFQDLNFSAPFFGPMNRTKLFFETLEWTDTVSRRALGVKNVPEKEKRHLLDVTELTYDFFHAVTTPGKTLLRDILRFLVHRYGTGTVKKWQSHIREKLKIRVTFRVAETIPVVILPESGVS